MHQATIKSKRNWWKWFTIIWISLSMINTCGRALRQAANDMYIPQQSSPIQIYPKPDKPDNPLKPVTNLN